MNCSPIVLFVYNRLDHTRETIEYLKRNIFADSSDLFIYSDASKNENQLDAVTKVREYIRKIDGFKTISIIERPINYGLSKSIIDGVSEILDIYDSIIVLEDDIVTSPFFLKFMNEALSAYKEHTNIGSITGYSLPISIPTDYAMDIYLTHRHSSWGWATYRWVWEKVDWDVMDYSDFKKDKKKRDLFNIAGEDMAEMLDKQMQSKINSWSIRFDYSCFLRRLYSVAPVKGLVRNIGFDSSGIHCSNELGFLEGNIIRNDGLFNFNNDLTFNSEIVKQTQNLFKASIFHKLKSRLHKYLEK